MSPARETINGYETPLSAAFLPPPKLEHASRAFSLALDLHPYRQRSHPVDRVGATPVFPVDLTDSDDIDRQTLSARREVSTRIWRACIHINCSTHLSGQCALELRSNVSILRPHIRSAARPTASEGVVALAVPLPSARAVAGAPAITRTPRSARGCSAGSTTAADAASPGAALDAPAQHRPLGHGSILPPVTP